MGKNRSSNDNRENQKTHLIQDLRENQKKINI